MKQCANKSRNEYCQQSYINANSVDAFNIFIALVRKTEYTGKKTSATGAHYALQKHPQGLLNLMMFLREYAGVQVT